MPTDPAADAETRPPFTLTLRRRDGPDYHGGAVVRITCPRRREGYPPADVAAMVTAAIEATHQQGDTARLVVLPAGVGHVGTLLLPELGWTDAGRLLVNIAIGRWSLHCGRFLPQDHPPIVLGLDGDVDFGDGSGLWSKAVQVAAVLDQRAVAHVTHKTKPRHADEAQALDIPWDFTIDRPAPDALLRHYPTTRLHGERTLLLVCHDAATFSPRSRRASAPGGGPDLLRRQYVALLSEPDVPRVAVNVIHRLPRRAEARTVTSSVFQSAHSSLHRDHGVAVIAVAGVHPDCAPRAFERLHTLLACPFRGIDVLVMPRAVTP